MEARMETKRGSTGTHRSIHPQHRRPAAQTMFTTQPRASGVASDTGKDIIQAKGYIGQGGTSYRHATAGTQAASARLCLKHIKPNTHHTATPQHKLA